jgi:hypothetical protein
METEGLFIYETLVSIYESTRRHNPRKHQHLYRQNKLVSPNVYFNNSLVLKLLIILFVVVVTIIVIIIISRLKPSFHYYLQSIQ